MQRTLSYLGKVVRKSFLVVCLMSVLLSGLLIFSPQPIAAAAYKANSPVLDQADTNSKSVESREEAYEEAIETIDKPDGVEKIYEENLKEYKEENPQPGIIQEAKELIKDVTKPE